MNTLRDEHWNAFYKSGKIEDYLRYKQSDISSERNTESYADDSDRLGRAGTDCR